MYTYLLCYIITYYIRNINVPNLKIKKKHSSCNKYKWAVINYKNLLYEYEVVIFIILMNKHVKTCNSKCQILGTDN